MTNKPKDETQYPDFMQDVEDAPLPEQPKEKIKKEKPADVPAEEQPKEVALTPKEQSAIATKKVFANKMFNEITVRTMRILDTTSKIPKEEQARLAYAALTKAQAALDEKGIGWNEIYGEMFISALTSNIMLGMDADQNDIYFIPRKKRKEDTIYVLSVPRSYRGEKKVCMKYSINKDKDPIEAMDAYLIREGDKFSVSTTSRGDEFEFQRVPLNDGKIKGAFAFVRYEKGRVSIKEMTPKMINDRKEASKKQTGGYLSPAWTTWEDEMILAKTFMALSKTITKDFKSEELKKAYDGGYVVTEIDEIEPENTAPRIPLTAGKVTIDKESV